MGDRVGEADVYGKLGNVFGKVGKFKEAEENYGLQCIFAREQGDRSLEAQALESVGTLNLFHLQLGDIRKAVEYFEKSLAISLEPRDESHVYGYLGIAFHRLGDLERALMHHQKNLEIVMRLDEKAEVGKAYGNLGRVYRSLGDFKQAVVNHELRLSIATKEARKVDEAIAHYDLACNFESLADFARESPAESLESEAEYLTQARIHYKSCAELLNDARPRHCGNARASTFNDEWNVNLFDEYKHVYTDLCRVLLKLHLYSEALLAAEQGRAQALRDFIESRYETEKIQPFLSDQDGTISNMYSDISADTVVLGIDTDTLNVWLLKPGQDVRFEQRTVHPTLNAADFLHTLIANAYRRCSVIVPLRGFHNSLQLDGSSLDDEDSNESDKSTDHDEFNQKETEIGNSFLSDLSPPHDDEALYQSDKSTAHGIEKLDQKETMIGEVNPFRTLYDVIFGPVVDHLQGGELVVAPEGPLCMVPFAAFVGPDSKFLCESFRIRVIPSLTSLKLITQGDHSESGALLVGDPCVQKVVYRGGRYFFTPLPFARREVEMIGQLLNIQPVIGEMATKMEVLDRITSAALVHIAAHASSESGEIALAPNPTRSSQMPKESREVALAPNTTCPWSLCVPEEESRSVEVALAPNTTSSSQSPKEEDYLLTMAEILNVQVRAQLVVLSCCHSGQGEIRAEGVVGIARAFLAAGARSVLVTLWAVEDEATFEFMKSFYEHLVKGESSSEALNQAMRCLRESERFSDVRHWAPFVLIGDDVTLTFPDKPYIVSRNGFIAYLRATFT